MTNSDYFTLLSALFAAIAAGFWFASSRVKVRVGYDSDVATAEDLQKTAKLNGRGAMFAALSALCSVLITAAKFVPWLAWLK